MTNKQRDMHELPTNQTKTSKLQQKITTYKKITTQIKSSKIQNCSALRLIPAK